MITNLWSTPRTGSVWYSMHLAKIYDSVKISEMFNPWHMTCYYSIEKDSVLNNGSVYVPDKGYFYGEYTLDDSGSIQIKKVFGKRTKGIDEELISRKNVLYNMNHEQNIVFHNHIHPIDQEVLSHLTTIAEKNVYIYRRDKRAQLASYAIAFTTKRFAKLHCDQRNDYELIDDLSDIACASIKNLCERIKVWESTEKFGEIIAYEDIDFYENENTIRKQVKDYTKILSPVALSKIDEMINASCTTI